VNIDDEDDDSDDSMMTAVVEGGGRRNYDGAKACCTEQESEHQTTTASLMTVMNITSYRRSAETRLRLLQKKGYACLKAEKKSILISIRNDTTTYYDFWISAMLQLFG
jgi:hypothetical protein